VLEAVVFGVGRRTPGNLPTAVMRMSVGPLGQWESPTIGHGQHHTDTVGMQLKMVQQIVVINLSFAVVGFFFRLKNQTSHLVAVVCVFSVFVTKHYQR
jgi:hypothetical protein